MPATSAASFGPLKPRSIAIKRVIARGVMVGKEARNLNPGGLAEAG